MHALLRMSSAHLKVRGFAIVLGLVVPLNGQAVLQVPGQYPTIGAALAASLPADVIRVAAGYYPEWITIDNGVHLIGSGASTTTIDGGAVPTVQVGGSSTTSTVIQGFTITGNDHGVYADGTGVTLVDCTITGTNAISDPSGGSAVREDLGAPIDLIRCRIVACGGPTAVGACAVRLVGCVVDGNAGDGVWISAGGGFVVDSLIINNANAGLRLSSLGCWSGPFGGLFNSTVYGNGTGLAATPGSSMTVTNSILWSNAIGMTGPAAVSWSNVQGGYAGTGNLNVNPMFTAPAAGDFSLAPGSPCIDAGDPAGPLDPDGSRADMGRRPDLPLLPGAAIGNGGVVPCVLGYPPSALRVNGTAGGMDRRVDVGVGQALTVSISPLQGATEGFAIAAYVGVPGFSDQVSLPGLGGLAFPPCLPGWGTSASLTLTNNLFADPCALVPSPPAPWSATLLSGLPFPVRVTLQGVTRIGQQSHCGQGSVYRTTNAVIVNVY